MPLLLTSEALGQVGGPADGVLPSGACHQRRQMLFDVRVSTCDSVLLCTGVLLHVHVIATPYS